MNSWVRERITLSIILGVETFVAYKNCWFGWIYYMIKPLSYFLCLFAILSPCTHCHICYLWSIRLTMFTCWYCYRYGKMRRGMTKERSGRRILSHFQRPHIYADEITLYHTSMATENNEKKPLKTTGNAPSKMKRKKIRKNVFSPFVFIISIKVTENDTLSGYILPDSQCFVICFLLTHHWLDSVAFIGFVSFNTIIIISLDFSLRWILPFFFSCFSSLGFHLLCSRCWQFSFFLRLLFGAFLSVVFLIRSRTALPIYMFFCLRATHERPYKHYTHRFITWITTEICIITSQTKTLHFKNYSPDGSKFASRHT